MPKVAAVHTSEKEQSARRNTTVNLRLPEKVRELIDAAAAATGKTRTEFMVDSAQRNAVDALLDQRLIELDAAQWKAFEEALANPPEPNDALRKLMAMTPPWGA